MKSFVPPPKVVFVNRYFHPDGSATSQLLTDLALELAASGFDIHVICSRQRYDDPTARLHPREVAGKVSVRRIWTTRFGRDRLVGRALDYATFYCSSGLALLRILKRGDTVVAKTDPPLMSIVAMAAARFKGAALINWLQDIFPEVASVLGANPLPRVLDALLRRWRNISLKWATTNVVLGERMRERLQVIGVAPERIRVVENWAELDPEKPKPVGSSALRERLGLSGKFVIGYSGNLGRAHDFHTLLAAAETMRNEDDTLFLMIGGGNGMSRLAQEVRQRRLENFCFQPYQPRESLADALAAADVHWLSLLPALEGLIVPSKFYGILAAGRPVAFIGDRDGELARELRACGCGEAVEVGDSRKLADVLHLWKSDPSLRDHMGRCGYDLYGARFCAQRALNQWKQILTPSDHAAGVSSPALSHR
jgi:glycosyltransferase involved in cell wall biosynthesis